MASVCCIGLVAGLAGCGGSKQEAAATTAAAAAADKKEETKEEAKETASADEKKFQIDLATAYAADGPAGVALAKFVDDVADKSGGSIEISLFTDGTLGSASDNYSSVASGDLDMTMSGLEGLDLYAPEYTFLDAPFLLKSPEHQKALLNSGIGEKLKREIRREMVL